MATCILRLVALLLIQVVSVAESCPIQQSQVVVPVIPKEEWAKYGGTGMYRTITFPERKRKFLLTKF